MFYFSAKDGFESLGKHFKKEMAENIFFYKKNICEIGEHEENTRNLVNCSENLASPKEFKAPVYCKSSQYNCSLKGTAQRKLCRFDYPSCHPASNVQN